MTLDSDHKAAYLLALEDLSYDAVLYACKMILREERFLPVPAVFRDHAKAWEKQRRTIQAAPSSGAELLAIREKLVSPEEVRALIASVWPHEAEVAPTPELPKNRKLREEDLHYEPTVDPEIAKAKIRDQVRLIQEQEGA